MKQEIRPLTGIRGIAAVLVMAYHFRISYAFADMGVTLAPRGYLCVDLFFVLSGFVLAMRHADFFDAAPFLRSYGDFLRSRAARIYPAYLVILLIYYAGAKADNTASYAPGEVAANILLIQNWGLPVSLIISDSWSVSTEAFAYLLFPLFLLIACKRSSLLCMALAAGAIGAYLFIIHLHFGVRGPLDAYRHDSSLLPLLRCLAGFSLGLVTFRFSQSGIARRWFAGERAMLAALLCVLAAILFDTTDLLTVLTFPLLVLCLFFDGRVSEALLGNRLVHHLGQVSYSLYLLHPFFIRLAGHYKALSPAPSSLRSVLFMLLGMGMTWMAAWLSYRLVERPGHAAVRKLLGAHK